MFVPRRVLYELRAGREYFVSKERCVFCDIIQQEERQAQRVIEARGDYLALCPYAPASSLRNLDHAAQPRRFLRADRPESVPGLRTNLGALLRRTLQRVRSVTEEFHLVLHTSPSSIHPSKNLGYWKTIDDDYHWHIEILPDPEFQGALLHIQRSVLFARQLRDRGEATARSEDRRLKIGAVSACYNSVPSRRPCQ